MNRSSCARLGDEWVSRVYRDQADYTRSTLPLWLQTFGQDLLRDSIVDLLVALAGGPVARVVDIGCGVGDWTVRYARLSEQVVGVDVNPSFLAEAHRRGYATGGVRFVCGDMRDHFDFSPGDLVCFGGTLPYLEDRSVEALIDRVARAQRAGDLVYVRATSTHGDRPSQRITDAHYRPVAEYLSAFELRGYRVLLQESSVGVVALRTLLRATGRLTPAHLAEARAVLGGPLRLARSIYRARDYYNYVFEKISAE